MKPVGDWRFNDLVLYAKGWYERKDLVADMNHIFETVYGYVPGTKHELTVMMLRVLDILHDHLEPGERYWWTSFVSLDYHINRNLNLYDEDQDEATIRVILNILLEMDASVLCIKKPVYGKRMYFRKGPGLCASHEDVRKSRTQTYNQMNEDVSRFFDK